MTLLKVNHLKVYYPVRGGFFRRVVDYVKAVDDISFEIREGETYGLVGESGCGKTTTGRTIIGLLKATSGEILFNDVDLTKLKRREFFQYRRDIQMIFQDPYSSLNPKKRILDIVAEPFRNYEKFSPQEEKRRVQELLERVGISPDSIYKYPHEFSGGQRQRIGIARALALKPKLIIADEPVSALDVSVQAQVLNFMKDIQEEFKLSYLFISHDLGIIRHMCDRIGIMYRGRLVEEGTGEDIYT
ncbi:MAG: ABC transporter ATP-binding protein, partial [Bacillaceae bacterium]|nr:ABC transporter ATP-binding protein [Bacillaceae bacterium]